jgi:glycosyl transferase family 2
MAVKLVSQVNGDEDLLEAWFKYYIDLGVGSFHLIVHGPPAENAKLFAIKGRFPVVIEDSYEGEYSSEEKMRRTNAVLKTMPSHWVIAADSDEFLELPYASLRQTIRMLELFRGNTLFAPLLQHVMSDGSLKSPDVVEDPFKTFPLCSVDLYEKIGSGGSIKKFPLFYCTKDSALIDGGSHNPPSGPSPSSRTMLGVMHHFKFRKPLLSRLSRRINSSHTWRHESANILSYLKQHDYRLPLDNSFVYSRRELFRRGLLRKFELRLGLSRIFKPTGAANELRQQ